MQQDADDQPATLPYQLGSPNSDQFGLASNTAATVTALSRRPDAVPPGRLSRFVYLCYAIVGLIFAIYNTNLIVRQMTASHEDPGFSSATLFYCMGMIPVVFALYLTPESKQH